MKNEKLIRKYIRSQIHILESNHKDVQQELPTQATLDYYKNRQKVRTDLPVHNPENKLLNPKKVKPKGLVSRLLISAAIATTTLVGANILNKAYFLDNEYTTEQSVEDNASEIAKALSTPKGGVSSKAIDDAIETNASTETENEIQNTQNVATFQYNSNDIDLDSVIERLKEHEGKNLSPYYDSKGYITIGIGTLITKENSNVSMANQNLTGDSVKKALQKLAEKYSSIYQYTEGDTKISDTVAEQLLQTKFNIIFNAFQANFGENFQYLPKEVKEVLADMSYNMGPNFFAGSSFIQNLKDAAELLKKNHDGDITKEEKATLRDLIQIEIPKEMADSDYFDELTSHDADPAAPGRAVINSKQDVINACNTYVGRPVNLLNIYKDILDNFDIQQNESLKKVYSHIFS